MIWAKIPELSGLSIISGVIKYIYIYFAPSGPIPKELSLRRKWETGYIMFRLYVLKYLFVGNGVQDN